ncbi:hypothetical protein DER46DRAFT_647599 [Fusarium sp. MPI-SDFR-AT-0072]|nr:hypothetical protein DER46DRAFT_647599 [Fusarium sp. MPI-SDFR-AT-0072]
MTRANSFPSLALACLAFALLYPYSTQGSAVVAAVVRAAADADFPFDVSCDITTWVMGFHGRTPASKPGNKTGTSPENRRAEAFRPGAFIKKETIRGRPANRASLGFQGSLLLIDAAMSGTVRLQGYTYVCENIRDISIFTTRMAHDLNDVQAVGDVCMETSDSDQSNSNRDNNEIELAVVGFVMFSVDIVRGVDE